ncbi:MAG: regulatory protein RecX [Lachnospiraceae bacterium]|nr:regulatory protein RecX [Lachnospiraceae bacterium]MBQ5535090.1 regulatory protein RecX [Lachnospiraceae bacterium]
MQLEIYKIEEYKKNRKLVYLDEGTPAFCLYTKEIKKYELAEGSIISEEVYGKIVELLSKRARERCLYLLESMARTERQLREKLKDAYYPEEAIEYALSYCKEKHYVDDLDYAERFIASRSATLSKKMIEQKLYQRGIGKDVMEQAFEEADIDEEEALRSLIERKYKDIADLSFEDRQKVIKKLMAKGFSYDAIKAVI